MASAFTVPGRRLDKAVEALMVWILRIGGWASVLVTFGIIITLVTESAPFFAKVPVIRLVKDTMWTPLFSEPQYGIGALLAGTLVTTLVALAVAVPLGTILAIYLSEFAPARFRELVKPMLELLSAVPTVVYGYFALLALTPLLQMIYPDLPQFSMLSAGLIMGIMIVPYVTSLGEDSMRSVPMLLREGAYALVTIERKAYLVIWPTGGEPGAFRALCPHQEAPLVDSGFDGRTLTCPHHRWT